MKKILALLMALTMLFTMNALAEALSGDVLVDFANGADPTGGVFASDGWSKGSVFNIFWKGDMVTYEDGTMHLHITDANGEVERGCCGGESRIALHYGFGDYSVRMKPAKVPGTANTFYTCIGSCDIGLDGNPNPWDEKVLTCGKVSHGNRMDSSLRFRIASYKTLACDITE